MSIPGQIVFETLAQVRFDDSKQILLNNIGNRVKSSRICMYGITSKSKTGLVSPRQFAPKY